MDNDKIVQKIEGFLQGNEDFANEIVERYFDQLVALARRKLISVPPQVSDSEGAVVSALRSFFSAVQKSSFPKLRDQDDLWRILATLTIRKAVAQVRRHWKISGEGGKVDTNTELIQLFASGPAPDDVVSLLEECENRILSLENDTLRKVASLTLASYSTREIAEELNLNQRTVQRKLELIRDIWRDQK